MLGTQAAGKSFYRRRYLGGVADIADMTVETILMKMEGLFYTLLGRKIADGNWGIDDPTELYKELRRNSWKL